MRPWSMCSTRRSRVIKNPDSTKKTSTPMKPPSKRVSPAWNATTRYTATARSPSSASILRSVRAGPGAVSPPRSVLAASCRRSPSVVVTASDDKAVWRESPVGPSVPVRTALGRRGDRAAVEATASSTSPERRSAGPKGPEKQDGPNRDTGPDRPRCLAPSQCGAGGNPICRDRTINRTR